MGVSPKFIYAAAILTVLLCLFVENTESRRVILKGRKTITRTYYYDSVIPAWLVVLLTALGEVIIGGILYIILKKVIIDPPISGYYNVQGENPSRR